jgi:hypothetical protein
MQQFGSDARVAMPDVTQIQALTAQHPRDTKWQDFFLILCDSLARGLFKAASSLFKGRQAAQQALYNVQAIGMMLSNI